MASTKTTFDWALKDLFAEEKTEKMMGEDRPLFGMIPRGSEFAGRGKQVAIISNNPQGMAGSSRAVAQANETSLDGEQFTLVNGRYFASLFIGDEVMKASRKNAGAFLEDKVAELEGLYHQTYDVLSAYAWGNGGNALCRRLSISTNTITVYDSATLINIEVGMTIVASAGDGSSTGHTVRAGSTPVVAVDRAAGTFEVANAAAITGFANNDYIFREGDFVGNTSTSVIIGMQYQVPGTSSPGVLYGVTRTPDPIRLSGCYVPAVALAGKDIEERIKLLAAYMSGRYRVKVPATGFLHPEDWQDLQVALASQGIRPLEDKEADFGYEYLSLVTAGKRQRIYADPFAPKGYYYALDLPTWKLESIGPLVHVLDGDQKEMLRKTDSDDYEIRLKAYPVMYSRKPSANGVVALT